jgi:DeoR/GlpR family transcriptional regulator of sugar metabolism
MPGERRVKPEKRQAEIVSLLRAMQRELTVEEIATQFGTSALTVRRDLDALVEAGIILRTYGGCIIRTGLGDAYQKQVARNFRLKQAIGATAADLVKSGEVILIDDGSTTFHLATNLESRAPITVVTNSIAVIPALARCPGIQVEILGGLYSRDTNFLGGSLSERLLEMLYFDAVFVGADAVDNTGKCMVRSADVARLTQVMLKRATRRFLLADHTKAGRTSHVIYGSLGDFDLWVTTTGISSKLLAAYRKLTTVKEVDWESAGTEEDSQIRCTEVDD